MKGAGAVGLIGWILLLLILSGFYLLKPDFAAAVTIFPAWTWTPLLLLPLLRWKALSKQFRVAVALATLLYTVSFGEEWRSLLRLSQPATIATLRVVSLNCAGGLTEAANEVIPLKPDIVLLQESPGRLELRQLATELWGAEGHLVPGPDGSILSRFPLTADPLPRGTSSYTSAVADVSGTPVRLVSLRLLPPAFRIDLINPDAWSAVAENRRARREQIEELSLFLNRLDSLPTIAGGDFNAQSGDTSLRSMPAWLRDTFYEAARGWGHTAVNEYPLARIDQIWVSEPFVAVNSKVKKTTHSDHRMVVVDLSLPERNR